jgi:hypothetical protein
VADAILRTLRDTWTGYLDMVLAILPRLLSMVSVLVVGILFAALARFVTARGLRLVRLPRLAERTGTAELLRKAELPPAERLTASLVFWLFLAGFLLVGLDVLGVHVLGSMRNEVSSLVPRLMASLAILAIGLVLANVALRVLLLATVNAGWPFGRAVSNGVYMLLVTVTVAMALEHLGVARSVVLVAFAIAFGALMLALAIALGIGGGPIVRRMLEERLAERQKPRPDPSSHL